MADMNFDLVVIGAGPGGYVAAIRAAQLGMKTAIVERESLGGICLNWGCIPTKALLRSAEVYRHMKHAASYGLAADNVRFDLDAIVKRSRDVSKRLSNGVGFLLKKNKVTVVEGTATLTGKGGIAVTAKDGKASQLSAKHIIVATGARARSFPGLEPDGDKIWTYRHALVPNTMPKSLLVIGSGAIGIEFASFFNALGSKVTVVELMDRVMPVEDEEISAMARKSFEKQGMTIHTGAKVSSLKANPGGVAASIELADGKKLDASFERAILAVGIVANTENLGLEAAGVKVARIPTDVPDLLQ
jgi:dihydrolipoamide dehydrogenase